jgi:regulator of protease activity HflC (stomatin/prohibitin superfamily)
MFWIVVTVILGLIGLSCLGGVVFSDEKLMTGGGLAGTLGVWAILSLFCGMYTQGPGEASALVSFSGEVVGMNYDQGIQWKAPWVSREVYDIRNNTLSYVADSTEDYTGGDAKGPQITVQDKDGATANIDVNVRYSIRGDAVEGIYREFKTQQVFVNNVLGNDVRATVRKIAAKFGTVEMFNKRDDIKKAIQEELAQNWDGIKVDLEDLYLQEVRYSEEVKSQFDQAQAARTAVEKAKAEQERAKIEAETNQIKTTALTDAVLKEKLIDAIRNGSGTYIIDTDNIAVGVK